MHWGTVNFDDHDWEHGHAADQDVAGPSAVWKVAAGVAIGIVIGATTMYMADRHIWAPAWFEMVQAFEQMFRGAGPTTERVPAPAARQAAAPQAAPVLPDGPAAGPPTVEQPRGAASAPAVAADALGRRAASTPGGPLTDLERKQRAWARYYKKPPHCDDNPTSDTLVECANHYIRARRQFDEAYAAGKL
jgi:hypothetical protein